MMYDGITMPIIFFLFFLILISIVEFHWDRRELYRFAKMIPGPKGYPLIGNSLDFLEDSIEKIFKKTLYYFETNPEVFKFWIGPKLIIGVSKPEDLEIILNHKDCLAKDHLYDAMKPLVGNGIIRAPVSIWKKHRKLINPFFKQKYLESFFPSIVKSTNRLVNALENSLNNDTLNIYEKINNCTISFMCEIAIGIEQDAQMSSDHFGHWIEQVTPILLIRMSNIFYRKDFIFRWSKYKKFHDGVLTKIHNFTTTTIKKKAQLFKQKIIDSRAGKVEDFTNDNGKISRKSFLDLLLEVSNDGAFTTEDMRDEMTGLLAGGTETTAANMSYCCLLLGMHPNIQQKVYEEIINVIGEDREVTPKDLPQLQYLERCIKETMRIFPIAPLIIRTSTADINIENCTIPANSTILICIMHNHRNAKYWKYPLKFDPDRFSPEEISKKHPYSYIPFSAGPRGCIGFKFAMTAMKIVLSKVIRKFVLKTKYSSVEEVDLQVSITLKPVNGFKVWIEPRS